MKKQARRSHSPDDLAWLAHNVPHRVRIRAPFLASRPDVCHRVAEALAKPRTFCGTISVHVLTGSIIIEAPDEPMDADVWLELVREAVKSEMNSVQDGSLGPSKVAQSIAKAFVALNADVRGGLHQRADLAALLPVCLAVLGVGRIVTTGQLPAPAWFNFGWWSFRAFMTFHKNAANVEKEPVASESKENS